MAGSLNKVQLIGNLGRDPEVRNTQSGNQVVHLNVATGESWRDKSTGERREKTEWHRVVLWDTHLGDIAKQYLRKGSKIYLEGQLQTRKWTDNSGQEKFTTEVVLQRYRGELTMLDGKEDQPIPGFDTPVPSAAGTSAQAMPAAEFDDEIPF